MSTKYKATKDDSAYFITITTVHWVDVFTRLSQRKLIVNALNYCVREKGLEIYAYCLMSNHLHMICRAVDNKKLSDILRDFKKFTSKNIIKNIIEKPESRREWMLDIFSKACDHLKRNKTYKVWQNGYHAEILITHRFAYQKLNYIHNNPVKDKIVEKPVEYLFSSARNYANLEGLVEVVTLPHQLITYS